MGATTGIEWCDATFNPWIGCTKVSAGCARCYAQTLVEGRMGLKRWGPHAPRVRTKGPWTNVRKWNADAIAAGRRKRVFCASLADVFEDHPDANAIRPDLWPLIDECRALDWQLLTKRPENIRAMLPAGFSAEAWPHVWLGTSCENQDAADERVPELLRAPARVRFLSCEPLLGPIDLRSHFWHGVHAGEAKHRTTPSRVHWVIVGGESGSGFRAMDPQWARDLHEQCRRAGVAFFFKQSSGSRPGQGVELLGEVVQQFPGGELPREDVEPGGRGG